LVFPWRSAPHARRALGRETLAVTRNEKITVDVRDVDPARHGNAGCLKEELRPRYVAHVPEIRAGFETHRNAVAGIVRRPRRIDLGEPLQIRADHRGVVFKTAARKDDGAVCLDGDVLALALGDESDDLAVLFHELHRGGVVQPANVAHRERRLGDAVPQPFSASSAFAPSLKALLPFSTGGLSLCTSI